ncbi:uncharacterized protein LOC109848499 isoform X2 [Asparagus officinalis]|nr:uncharacterized protein LOC109848499 isoform X2 [Asparagus officinalis]
MEPLHVEEKLTEKTLHQRSPYHDAYEEQAYTKPEWWFPTSHEMKDESYGYAYNKYQYTEPLHIEENSTETMLHQRLTYYDFDEEQGYPKPERWFSSYDATKDQSCSYDYNKYNNYMEPLHIEENFMDPMLHQRLTYHDTEEHTYPKQSSYSEFGENNFHVDHQYSCERPTNEQPLSFELEPYKPTWSQNLNHQEYYGGELSLQSFNSSVENGWCESNTFGDPNNAYKCHYSDQPLQIQLEPFKPAWAQNSTINEPYIQEGSPSSCVRA